MADNRRPQRNLAVALGALARNSYGDGSGPENGADSGSGGADARKEAATPARRRRLPGTGRAAIEGAASGPGGGAASVLDA